MSVTVCHLELGGRPTSLNPATCKFINFSSGSVLYKSLKPQSCSQQQPSYPFHVSSSEDRCLLVSIFRPLLAILFSHSIPRLSHALIPPYLPSQHDVQVIYCYPIPRFNVLRQCCCSSRSVHFYPLCTRRTLLSSI